MIQLVGFTGLKGSGKDTAADALVRRYGYQKLPLAGPLKDMLIGLLQMRGCTNAWDYVYGDLKEAPTDFLLGKTARHAMQTLGTEWGRNLIDPGIWTDTFTRRAKALMADGKRVVVTDVRFPNEVELLKSLGGKVFRIQRPGVAEADHASENQVMALDVDDVIWNEADTAARFRWEVTKRVDNNLKL